MREAPMGERPLIREKGSRCLRGKRGKALTEERLSAREK
jgi:hypothetical protein